MLNRFVEDLRKGSVPNKFTRYMGEQIKTARLEAKLSQRELAELTYFRQASISDIENGKREITTAELTYLCDALGKPISYFFPEWMGNYFVNELSEDEETLIITLRDLSEDEQKRILLIAKAFHNNQ